MAYRQEELVAEIIEEAGLLPRAMRMGIDKKIINREKEYDRDNNRIKNESSNHRV